MPDELMGPLSTVRCASPFSGCVHWSPGRRLEGKTRQAIGSCGCLHICSWPVPLQVCAPSQAGAHKCVRAHV